MKKKILSGIFALALLITAGYGVSKSLNGNADLSLLALSNVEALAQYEQDPPPSYDKWSSVVLTCYDRYGYPTGKTYTYCFKPGCQDNCTPTSC